MKIIKRIGIVLGIVVVILGLAVAALYPGMHLRYRSFFGSAEAEMTIPGLSDGLVPQGLDYSEETSTYLFCGYVGGDQASRIYLVDGEGKASAVSLKNGDGSDYLGHTGGVAHFQNYLYVPSADGLDVFLMSDILSGKESVSLSGSVKAGLDPAYCFVSGDYLIAGSFYRAGNYETPEHERIVTPAGDQNYALAVIFALDETAPFGVDPVPVGAISTRGLVQGMCFTGNGQAVISASYAVASSELCFYDLKKAQEEIRTVTLLGEEIPLIFFDSSNLIKTVEAPPMSEDLLVKDGRIWILNESASDTYIFGKFTGGKTLYSYSID